MNYPLISDYVSSILSAEDNFKELTHLRPELDEEGQPIMSSGNFAVVFKMKDEQTGKLYAVKCFLKEQEGRAESYKLIEEELECISSNYLTPIRYMEDELFVDSSNTEETEFPVLLMDWVEGMTLDKYVRYYIGNIYTLSMLVYRFSRMASWLLPQPFAHGDLKCDNIIVKEDGTLVLVDYDGMYVPAMKGQKAREIGSPDFRHPKRTENYFDEHIDDFAISSILLSLKAISLNPDLLRLYGDSDRLLFSQKDYLDLSICNVIDALRPLMIDDELNILLSLFLLAHSRQELSLVSFQLVNLKRPKENIQRIDFTNHSVDLSDAEVQLEMGRRFAFGFGIPKKFTEAFKWFTLSAEQDNAIAQNHLGYCYGKGVGIAQNSEQAFKWYLRSAEQGNTNAKYNLGNCYFKGEGIAQNYKEAIKWYIEAAKQGHAGAQNNLGRCFDAGKGVTQNYKEAIKWFLKSAEQGNMIAQNNLGISYFQGRGMKPDYEKAAKWYLLAAEQGNVNSQLHLGKIYYEGKLGYKDYKKAITWFEKANENGSTEALYYLAKCYENGFGVQKNCGIALRYYEKAYLKNDFNLSHIEHCIDEILQSYNNYELNLINDEGAYYTNDYKVLVQAPKSFDDYIIKEGCEYIGAWAFGGRGNVGNIIIPNSIKMIGMNPFYKTSPLNVICNSDLYEVILRCLYTKGKRKLIAYLGNNEEELRIADGTQIIAQHAFTIMHNIRRLYIPSSVVNIEKGAFCESVNISSVFVPISKMKQIKEKLPIFLHSRIKSFEE